MSFLGKGSIKGCIKYPSTVMFACKDKYRTWHLWILFPPQLILGDQNVVQPIKFHYDGSLYALNEFKPLLVTHTKFAIVFVLKYNQMTSV